MKGILFLLIGLSLFTQSEISSNPNDWYGVTDRVMGGKSNLQVEFVEETFVLRGNVTTQNNGGFVRLVQDIKLNDDSLSGISFLAKGNNEIYEIYFKDLKSSGYSSRKIEPKNINNIAFAGYGRDFDVNLMIKDISVF